MLGKSNFSGKQTSLFHPIEPENDGNLEDDATLFQRGPITRYPRVPAVKKSSRGVEASPVGVRGVPKTVTRHSVCFEVPKPMCSTSKLQVWKSHLSNKQRNKQASSRYIGLLLKGLICLLFLGSRNISIYIYIQHMQYDIM